MDEKPRLPKAQPWNIGSVVPWSVAATIGDPVLLVAPLAATVFGIIAVLGLGTGTAAECVRTAGCPAQILVPLWSLPPFDAYQDTGAIGLAASNAPVVWLLRTAALLVRALFFGAMAHLALQRAYDRAPETRAAITAVRSRFGSLVIAELVGYSVFGIPLVLGQGSLLAAGRPVSQLGALLGQILLINVFFAVFTEKSPARALAAGFGWVRRRPLGHLGLCVLSTAVSNGVFWLATAGEAGRPRDVTLSLYALLHAVTTTVMLVAFARRWRLLYLPEATQKDAPRPKDR